MKILILTQPLIENYGGILQNYALQTVLKRRGHSVTTLQIDYTLIAGKFYLSRILSLIKHFLLILTGKSKTGSVRNWLTKKEAAICYRQISNFIQHKIAVTPLLTSRKELRKHLDYDAYVVGSDQVWRKEYSPHLPTFFLDFLPPENHAKKIAYAASFGNNKIDFILKHIDQYYELMQRFGTVSVREPSGKELCQKYFDVSAEVVPDPTMMLSPDDYERIIGPYKGCAANKLVTYILDETAPIKGAIAEFAAVHHLETVRLRGTYSRKDFNSSNPEKSGIEFWLGAIESAEYVITDSFHGTVFSLLFNKKFFSFVNFSRGKDRFDMLDNIFSISSRFIDTANPEIKSRGELDYNAINSKFIEYRKKGEDFLQIAGL